MTRLPVDPRHGTHEPTRGTPDRAAGSVRRTTSIDMLRLDGLRGDLVLVARGRDLRTGPDGDVAVIAEAAYEMVIDYTNAQTITAVSTDPPVAGIGALAGGSASAGFRGALHRIAGAEFTGHPVYQLLDDVPVAALVSGFVFQHALGVRGDWNEESRSSIQRTAPAGRPRLQVADLCAGWQAGGSMMQEIDAGGMPVVVGPAAPSLAHPDDAWAWHDLPGALPGDSMRRVRRIDVIPGDAGNAGEGGDGGAPLTIDALFRDSHMGDDGLETIVHEYTVAATVDPRDFVVLDAIATPQVLPWMECPQAAASARRLAGQTLAGLRNAVRRDFVGPTTCTHLNDTLRALEDVPALAAQL